MCVTRLSSDHRRYLELLGVRDVAPDLDGLRRLVRAHVSRVPFENVSKLLLFAKEGAGRPIALCEFLDGIEHRDLGGTCYSSNPFLFQLLRALGYDVDLLSADMRTPDVHSSIRVRLGGEEYHVDVGYAAPFREPIALNRLPHTIVSGWERYVMDSSVRAGAYELRMFVRGEHRHGYVVHPPPRRDDFFTPAILDSYAPGRTFMRCLRLSRILDDRAVDIRNRRLIVSVGHSVSETPLDSASDLRDAVDHVLMMPRCPVLEAVGVLEDLTGRSFFGPEGWADSID